MNSNLDYFDYIIIIGCIVCIFAFAIYVYVWIEKEEEKRSKLYN